MMTMINSIFVILVIILLIYLFVSLKHLYFKIRYLKLIEKETTLLLSKAKEFCKSFNSMEEIVEFINSFKKLIK